jgi:hypothetical protein
MFDKTIVCHHTTNVTVSKPKPQPPQNITVTKQQAGTVFVHCKKGDKIWKGLFYETPFLNRSDSSRGHFWSVEFSEWNPNILAPYREPHYLSAEAKMRESRQHDENEKTILRVQAVDVVQLKLIGNNEVIAEVRYLNPPEV